MLPDESIALIGPVLVAGKSAWHPDYDRVVAYAALCRQFATGDVTDLLRVYWPNKTADQFAELARLYIQTCEGVWKEVATPFYQVARLRDGQVERKFTYDEALSEPQRARYTEAVTGAVDKYYNGKPLQDYLAERIAPTVAMTDPNAWLLTQFDAFDYRTQRARPYPVLLPSSAVVHFTRSAGEVTSLTARYVVSAPDNTATLWRYTTYLATYAVDYWPVFDGKATMPGGELDGEVLDGDKVVFHYRVYEHGAPQVPAYPIGYVPDQGAVGDVFLSPLHAAISWLKMELKTGHELQLVMRNMAQPKQLQYVQACTGYVEDGGCVAGMCTSPRDGNQHDLRCRKCGGSGQNVVTSAGDVLTFPLSADPTENKLKLSDYLVYVGPDASIPELQLKYQDWISDRLKKVLFNTDTLDKTQATDTATARRIQLEQKAIALSPFADAFSGWYVCAATVSAWYVDAGQGFSCVYDFPDDLELTSLGDLYDQLTKARAAGARPDEVARIQLAIMRKSLASDPSGLRRYQVRSRFIPLLGFDDKTIVQWSALGRITEKDQLMYVNQDRIFADAETATPRFYDLSYKEQLAAVEAQVQLIRDEATPAVGATRGLNLNPTTPLAVGAAPAAPAVPVNA